mmetsp:Transcript_81966/g.244463  ORF Transcript_81966/g.244463 Transcript_81966/m.244463 type:complete len:240 (+) Transcript_81966:741-1460(+)
MLGSTSASSGDPDQEAGVRIGASSGSVFRLEDAAPTGASTSPMATGGGASPAAPGAAAEATGGTAPMSATPHAMLAFRFFIRNHATKAPATMRTAPIESSTGIRNHNLLPSFAVSSWPGRVTRVLESWAVDLGISYAWGLLKLMPRTVPVKVRDGQHSSPPKTKLAFGSKRPNPQSEPGALELPLQPPLLPTPKRPSTLTWMAGAVTTATKRWLKPSSRLACWLVHEAAVSPSNRATWK